MTSPKQLKYWRKMLKSFIGFIWILFAILIALKKYCMFSNIYFLCKKNVHPVLNILTRQGKFVSVFLDFYLFF